MSKTDKPEASASGAEPVVAVDMTSGEIVRLPADQLVEGKHRLATDSDLKIAGVSR